MARVALVVLLGAMTSSVLAQGQTPERRVPTTFDQLSVLVGPGEKVTVTDAAGERYSGRVANISATTLSLKMGKTVRELREGEVLMLRQRRDDTLRNGALWGLGTGAAVGFATCGFCHAGPGVVAAGLYGGIGAGIGVGIDALIRSEVTVFQRPGADAGKIGTVTVVPQLAKSHKGVAVSVKF